MPPHQILLRRGLREERSGGDGGAAAGGPAARSLLQDNPDPVGGLPNATGRDASRMW